MEMDDDGDDSDHENENKEEKEQELEDTPKGDANDGDNESMKLNFYPDTPRITKEPSRTMSPSLSSTESLEPSYVPPSRIKKNVNKLKENGSKILTRSAVKQAADPTFTANQIAPSPISNADGFKYKLNRNEDGGDDLTIIRSRNGFYDRIFVMDGGAKIEEYQMRKRHEIKKELLLKMNQKMDKMDGKIEKNNIAASGKKKNNNNESSYVDIKKSPIRLFQTNTARLKVDSKLRGQRADYCGELVKKNLGHDPDQIGRCIVAAIDTRKAAEYVLDHCKDIQVIQQERIDAETKEIREDPHWCYIQAAQLCDEGQSFRGNDRMRTGEKDRTYDTDNGMSIYPLYSYSLSFDDVDGPSGSTYPLCSYSLYCVVVDGPSGSTYPLHSYSLYYVDFDINIQDQWPDDHNLNQINILDVHYV